MTTTTARHRIRRPAIAAAALAAAALAGGAGLQPVDAAPASPPDGTFEIDITSDDVIHGWNEPISYEATCWTTAPNTGVTATIIAVQLPEPGGQPANFTVVVQGALDAEGAISGHFTLPGASPEAEYALVLSCVGPNDQEVGGDDALFTLADPGPVIEQPPVVPPEENPPVAPPAPPAPNAPSVGHAASPAAPMRGTVALTG